jgi:ankyrin repeat protein
MMLLSRTWPKCPASVMANLTIAPKRSIFTAIQNNYDITRLKKRLKDPNALFQNVGDENSPLHIAFGASPWEGLRLPRSAEPPKKFTALLLKAALEAKQIDVLNGYGQTPLYIAAQVNYYDPVHQLLKFGANPNGIDEDGQTPLQAYIMSTVSFDPDFKIGELLLKHGAKVKTNALFSLFNSIGNMCYEAKECGNPLYADLNRIKQFHFDHFPKKAAWLLKSGAKIEKYGQNVLLNCFREISPYESQDLTNVTLRSLIPVLVENSDKKEINYEDEDGWSFLHWAAFRGCIDVVDSLMEKELSLSKKDKQGITPVDLAVLNGSFSMLKKMKLDFKVEVEMLKRYSDFSGHLISKLSNYGTTKSQTGLPALTNAPDLDPAEIQLISPYRLVPQGENVMATPIAVAMQNGHVLKVLNMIDEGWNFSIHNDFINESLSKHPGKKIIGFKESLQALFYEKYNKIVVQEFNVILLKLNQTKTSGITLSSELNDALKLLGKGLTANYVINLFKIGLSSKIYEIQTGQSLREKLYRTYDHSYDNEHGWREFEDYQDMCEIIKYVEKHNIC